MSFQLPSTQEKAAFVHDQFERIARRYDLLNDLMSLCMHRQWKNAAVAELVGPQLSGDYLDVCCGTGDLAIRIAKRLKPEGTVTGIDFSKNMLSVAASRSWNAKQKGDINTHLNWIQGDALELPFPDNSFDGAIISFGLRNLTDLPKGIKEMARVVKPGGRIINLDLGHPSLPLFTPIFMFYFRHIVPILGEILQQDRSAYTYLPESLRTFPKPEVIASFFRQANLDGVYHRELAFGTVAMNIGTKSK